MELTKNEIEIINRFSNALLNSININSKMCTDDTKKGYYPYIPNSDIASLVRVMLQYKIKSIADLGCGEAHILYMLNLLRFNIMGVEVTETYIKVAEKLLPSTINIIHKDIFDLKPNEIRFRKSGWEWEIPDALYFYEPVFTESLAFDFVDKIMYLVRTGQYILHKSASPNMTAKFQTYVDKGQLVLIEAKGIWVYKKLKKNKYRKY